MKASGIFFLLTLPCALALQAVSLENALSRGWVKASIHGSDTYELSSHYGPCMKVALTNLLAQPLSIEIETGRMLVPENEDHQKMVVTKPLVASLKSREEKAFPIYAMCAEKPDFAPTSFQVYHLSSLAPDTLLQLSHFIHAKNYQNAAGQSAVWIITDDEPMDLLCYQSEGDGAAALVDFLVQKAGRPKPACESYTNEPVYETVPTPPARPLVMVYSGELDFTVASASRVQLLVVDRLGRKVKEVVDVQTTGSGRQSQSYEFDTQGFEEGEKYILRLVINGVVKQEKMLNY